MKRITRIALFVAIALIMHFIESALPPLLAFAPNARMGLGNIVLLVALVILCYTDAYVILVVKCILAAVFGGNIASLMYSLPAGVSSLTVMILLYHFLCPKISLTVISLAGAIVHNLAQLLVAGLTVKSFAVMTMIPLTLGASVIAGVFVGLLAYFLVKGLPVRLYADNISTNKDKGED